MIISDSFNEIYQKVIKDVSNTGITSAPRGMEIFEKIGYSFILTNPLNSLCTLTDRKLNYKFAMIEKLEYLFGVSSVDRISYYNRNMRNFANNNGDFDGAYGPRLGRQYNYIIDLLKRDPDSRQAVLNINSEIDKRETKDVPCTVSIQFLLRDRKLNMVVFMRSQDCLWGLPYDINGFCFIQEALAFWLGVEVGNYTHMVGSIHIYKERQEQLLKLLNNEEENDEFNGGFNISREDFISSESNFWSIEYDLRNEKVSLEQVITEDRYKSLPSFLQGCIKKLKGGENI